ncbi:MAG: GTP cyclohydrolase I FolE2 [Candidatus Eremiobacteraeota bacterium]|nr:GTP cyclohydrolase I FolE2 [Candidatus Eremiobacteraeota bacterium]MBV8373852.1 GTP cyclohydrolase I FolE2 [Candidatus Eremiobacteraeota bacterium]
MRVIYVGIGSNLGDRQANILTALQRLRSRAHVAAVSAFYESEAAGGAEGPEYLNVAAALHTDLSPEDFVRFARDVETKVGRAGTGRKRAPRPIDIDLLAIDGTVVRDDLQTRAYNAVPLAEIAPHLVGAHSNGSVRRRERSLHFSADRQDQEPDVRLSLDRVGVSGVRRVVHLSIDGDERVYNCELSMVADLAPHKAGLHLSRFTEILEEASLEVLARDDRPARIERLGEAIAREIVGSQRAVRAEVRLRAEFGMERWTPVSGKRGEETYALLGVADADERGVRSATGVEAEGMTACPCAQSMIREHSLHELRAAGFSEADARRALDALPVATHNQRGRGSILIGVSNAERADGVRAEDMVEIVESAMSSETYDLLKRPDEFFIVNKAHHNPKFVEDVVRGMLARALDMYSDLDDDTFVCARQINYESIHKHDAFAEAFGRFGELRHELASAMRVSSKTDLAAWLHARPE